MAANRLARKLQKGRTFGKNVLKQIRRLKERAEGLSGPITKVLHEFEGKMLRAAGVVAKTVGRKKRTNKGTPKK